MKVLIFSHLTAEDDFSSILGYRLRALHFKGTEIFFLTAEDDFSAILGYRLRALHFKGTDIFLFDC